jgi:molybdopterin converting factor small subunit
VSDGSTVSDLLEEIASEYREFGETLFNAKTGNLSDHLSIILNGKFFELSGGLAAKLKSGDTLRLMLAFSGG